MHFIFQNEKRKILNNFNELELNLFYLSSLPLQPIHKSIMANKIEGKTNKLTISLVKKSIKDLKAVIGEDYQDDVEEVKIPECELACFIFKEPNVTSPSWYKYLESAIDGLPDTQTSPSAVLVIKTKKNMFAVSFGYGRYLIEDSAIVPDFGLKVSLNAIPSDKIKTVDKRTLEQMALHSRQQAVVPVDFSTFELEVDRDLVKSIEGQIDEKLGSYLKGSINLSISTKLPLSKLSELCSKLHSIYLKKDYQQEFGWIDNVKPIQDPSKSAALNLALVDQINKKSFPGIFLGAPELIDDIDVGGYKFRGPRNGSTYILFPSINSYASLRLSNKNRNPITIEQLKSDKIICFDRDSKPNKKHQWSVYKCIHAEIKFKGDTYKLLEGNWYEVDSNFISRIDKQIKAIPVCKEKLLDLKSGESENDYNNRLASHLKGTCLDAQLVTLKGRSRFEFCDVLKKDKKLFHVKKHYGASSMSHLFYQAYVSGQTYCHFPQCRPEIAKLKGVKKAKFESVVHPKTFKTSDYEIVICVASSKAKPIGDVLSFFSKISLVHKHRTLSSLGYKVSVAIIPIV